MLNEIAISDRDAFAIGAAMYSAACLFGLITLLLRKPYSHSITFALLCGGCLLQTLGLNLRGAEIKACPLGNLFEITQFICWSLVLLYFIIGPIFRLRLLGFFTAGLAAVLCATALVAPGWDTPYPAGIFGGNPWVELHAALAILSYAVFAIVALVSVMFLIQQHGLKHKQFKGVYQYLPSVQQLDLMAKRLLITGVSVLSAALICGVVLLINTPELVPSFKLAATCLVWLGYLLVVILRLQKRLVTRYHALASIALFLFALASLWPVQSASGTKLEPTLVEPATSGQ
jgi:HemX protein